MASAKSPKPDVVTYGDHERITPDTSKLRKTVREALPDEPDPVVIAEVALEQISGEFAAWMIDECERLDAARRKVKAEGLTDATRQELFLAAHDIKGHADTFGYPELMPAADSLCRLLEHTPEIERIPITLVDQHVDAVRAIVREYARSDAATVATELTHKLRSVTDEFLVRENRDRPEILKVIQSPSLAPNELY